MLFLLNPNLNKFSICFNMDSPPKSLKNAKNYSGLCIIKAYLVYLRHLK
jgi:hypothetical protein